jgi:hypothetical protein
MEIIRFKERFQDEKDAFIYWVEKLNRRFKFSTDPNNLGEDGLKKLVKRYPDNLSRAIIAYAALHAIKRVPGNVIDESHKKAILAALNLKEKQRTASPFNDGDASEGLSKSGGSQRRSGKR